jgi:putative transposase
MTIVSSRSFSRRAQSARGRIARSGAHGGSRRSLRGGTYASTDYRKALKNGGIECSMTRKGDCYDDAVAESFFSSLKREIDDADK